MMRIASFAQPMLCQSEKCSRLKHSKRLTEKSTAVRHVHRDVLSISPVEDRVRVWQSLPVAVFDRYGILHPDKRRQLVARFNERSSDVQAVNLASETFRQIPCRTAYSTTDIENSLTRLNWKGIGQLNSGWKPTRVKMVDGCQLFDRHGFGVDPGSLHGVNYRGVNVTRSPMVRN